VLAQNYELSLEKVRDQTGMTKPTTKEFTDRDVYNNVNEFFSFQTYNSQLFETLKYLTLVQDENNSEHPRVIE
jgi:hypothetical protein